MSKEAQDALTEEQLEALLDAVNRRSPTGRRNLALLTLMADTGLRVSEALSLQTRDLVREAGQLTHVRLRNGKGGRAATIALPSRTAVRLATWVEARGELGIGEGPVFCTISTGTRKRGVATSEGFAPGTEVSELVPGKAISRRYVQDMIKRMAERAGLDPATVTPHTLRHTFATHLLRRTGDIKLVQQALRHGDLSTTAHIYSHLTDQDVEDAVRALRPAEEPAAPEQTEDAEALAEGILEVLPADVREALRRRLEGGE